MIAIVAAALLLMSAVPALAQVDGYVSGMVVFAPDLLDEPGRQSTREVRTRIYAERRQEFGTRVRLNLAAYVDALARDTDAPGGGSTVTAAVIRPSDLYLEFVGERADVRFGASRLVWGRLDEFQPTDVVNPIDLTRFLLEGRSEARLPVAMMRGRLFLRGASTLEAVVVPVFRASTFDQLDEATSPFNLAAGANRVCAPGSSRCTVLPVERRKPATTFRSVQGGARLTSTVGRVDVGVSAYRGFRSFPLLGLDASKVSSTMVPGILESFPRFTMVGGDFETVRGEWGLRGELAAFLEDRFQAPGGAPGIPGRSLEAGVGADRRAGSYRVAANVLFSYRRVDADDPLAAPFDGDDEVERHDVSFVGSAERSFARETRTMRLFAVYDPDDRTMFVRSIAAVSLRDNVWLEGSAGLFAGSSADTLGRLTRRDFIYTRLKVHF